MRTVLFQFKSGLLADMNTAEIDNETMYRAWDRARGEWIYYAR